MSRTLFISDLDGTLLGPDSRLSATTVTLLNHAISRGALFSVATARTPATVAEIMRDVDVRLPMVVMTGAALWDKNTGEYSDVQNFLPEQVKEIIPAYRGGGGGGFLYTLRREPGRKGEIMKIYHFGSFTPEEQAFMQERVSSPFKSFDVPASGESDIPAEVTDGVLFFGMQPTAAAQAVYSRLERIRDINPMLYHDWHGDKIAEIEAFPRGATKARAIRRLAKRVGADRIVVYGDNLNDLSMMRSASWGVAVANAVEAVKREADEVIGSNVADAVPRHILSMLR